MDVAPQRLFIQGPGRECILALLSGKKETVVATSHTLNKSEDKDNERSPRVRVQWDPGTVRLEKLRYRSIYIRVPGAFVKDLTEGICLIEDVTERARELKRKLDETQEIDIGGPQSQSLIPDEKTFVVSDDLRRVLEMEEQK